MGNFSEILKNGGRSGKAGKRPKPDKRWTILFIGNHGKTITLERFKGMVLLTCLVLGISIAIAVGLLYLSLNIRQEKKLLESDLQELKAQLEAMRYEKDVLLTKLVLAESRSKANPPKYPTEKNESAIPQQNIINKSEDTRPSTKLAKNRQVTPVEKKAEPPAVKNQAESGLSVAVENFKISARADEKLLRIQFKLKNTSPNSQRVSGHAIVVLKGEQLQQNKWLSIPRVSLSDGKPSGSQRGHSFGINYFKTMRFKTNLPKAPEIYQSVTVFIFTPKGDLLLEQDFPVRLLATPPATTSTPSSGRPAASSQTSSSRSSAGQPPVPSSNPPATTTATKPSTSNSTPPSPDD